ncbi:MAG TPA: TonB-dependent receptor [Blastocatellia bacterium]|nr:TonB-dependent receptor [Blastocatellia bacterium]
MGLCSPVRLSLSVVSLFGICLVGGLLAAPSQGRIQSTATLLGRVVDSAGAVVAGVDIGVRSLETNLERATQTDALGNYQVSGLPVGDYRVEVRAPGFQTAIVDKLAVEVGRSVIQDFELRVGDFNQEVKVAPESQGVERTTSSVGHVVDLLMVQQLPLNGRYFLDLGLLVASSATPPQGAFSAAPMRGLGSLAINTGGNREETVNYLINGITLNNLTFGSISFQPSISTVQEFKIDNSTFSAEYGLSSGAIVNIATRSGANEFHGELFEFLRNDALDARNFFTFTSAHPPPFTRNQFGGNVGGPIVKDKLFFSFSYEVLRQRQGLDLNSIVLSDAERSSATVPVVRKLIELIPQANFVDSSGTPRFIGSARAPVNSDQATLDIGYNVSDNDRLHGYYDIIDTDMVQPNGGGSTIPGFGNFVRALRQIFTLSETHIFSATLVNEVRFGFNRWHSSNLPDAQLDPADFGISDGIHQPIGLPQISIAGGNLSFGGPSAQPSGRGDTTFVVADTVSHLMKAHSIKLGGEYRQFLNNNIRQGTGSFTFPSVADFLAGDANAFSITLGNQSSSIEQGALGFFVQDNYRLRPNLTLELGLRYDWNMTPSERYGRFIVFDPASDSLVRAGASAGDIYHQNNRNIQPRVGFAWDPFGDGKTSLRAAYAVLTDQPMTSVVLGTAANPPLAIPLTFTGRIRFENATDLARAAGLAPQTIAHDFDNAYMQSWNLNLQRQLTSHLVVMAGYFGSKGTHLILRRNINQPSSGARPFPALSVSSPILPGTPLGNITEVDGAGNSAYNAFWVTANQRLARGLEFSASYTWSKSLDYNSFSTQGIAVQNSYNLAADRGLSDFDARHRLVISAIYVLPLKGNRCVEGWQIALIVQAQSGNPVNIVTSNSTVNGVPGTLRPDVTGPINSVGTVERWFDTSAFSPVAGFGNLGRNVVIGPAFNNIDLSINKNTGLTERLKVQFRAEFFDLFNHPNFGQPGNMAGTPSFGRITSTRFATGESGSSRQVQFALKLVF